MRTNDWTDFINSFAADGAFRQEGIVCFALGEDADAPKSRLFFCTPWAGVYLWANRIADRHLPYSPALQSRFVTINYCLAGRCEVRLPDDTYIYMKPGMLSLDDHEPKDGYAYPSRAYEGLEIAFDWDRLRAAPDGLLAYGDFDRWIEALLDAHGGSCLAAVSDGCKEQITRLYVALLAQPADLREIRFSTLCLLHDLKNGGVIAATDPSFVTRGQRQIVTEIEERLTKDLSQRSTVAEMAAAYGISPSALKKYFESVFGQPISRYLRQKRMERAKSLLANTRLGIGEIAEQCGYAHQGKFGSVFRAETGITPLEYRRIHYRKEQTHETE